MNQLTRSASPQHQRGAPPPTQGTRRASIAASTYNAETHTVDAVFSTGARVRRYFGSEELDMSTGAVDLSRATGGRCPLLNAHNQWSVGAVLGTIERATLAAGQLSGTVRFADTPAGREAEGMVARGELTGLSIGYAVTSWVLVETNDETGDVWRAARWELMEVSLVPIPADPAAGFRSAGNPHDEEEDDMMTRNAPAAPPAPPSRNPADITARSITTAARNAGLDIAAVDELLARHDDTPFTRDTLMADIGRRFAERDSQAPTNGRHNGFGAPAGPQLRERLEGALFARMTGGVPTDEAREFMGLSMAGMARAMLENRGEQVRWQSDAAVIERAMMGTTDFPALLTASGNRYLLTTFEAASSGIKRVARERLAPDFRAVSLLKLSGAGVLSKVNETGEVRHGSFEEGKEGYRLATFAKIFGVSRQAIINDDLGAFVDPLRLMARAAAETEAMELAALLNANGGMGPTMTDGKTLFHADHGNLASSGAALAVASLGAGRQGMRDQLDLDGKTHLNVVPKTLLVGSGQETLAEQVLTGIAATKAGDVNPFPGKLGLEVDPRLVGTPWRLFADPALNPVLEYAYLSEAKGPQMESRAGWNVLGTEFRVSLDFGCGAVDARGAWQNPGA